MTKLIICLYGVENSGKTSVIRKLANKFKLQSKIYNEKEIKVPCKSDFRLCFHHERMKVGIASGGDTLKIVKENLDFFFKENCDVMIITARSGGKSHKEINKHSKNHEIIWYRQADVHRYYKGNSVYKNNLVSRTNNASANFLYSLMTSD